MAWPRVCAALFLVLSACSDLEPDPPYLVGFTLFLDHQAGVSGLRVPVVPSADGTLVLGVDAGYIAETTVWTAGSEDRCIFRPASYSWAGSLTGRLFSCSPETRSGRMIIQNPISTDRFLVQAAKVRGDDHFISVRISEWGSPSNEIRRGEGELRFPVRFER